MNTISELNSWGELTLDVTDERPSSVTFDRTAATNQFVSILEGQTHSIPVGVELLEVINYQSAATYFQVDLSAAPAGTTVTWASQGGNTLTNPSANVYRLSGNIKTSADWDVIKSPTVGLPNAYFGNFTYTVTVSGASNTRSYIVTVNVSDVVSFSTPTAFSYTPGIQNTITGQPTVTDEGVSPGVTWTITITPLVYTSQITAVDSTGGSVSFNGTTKVTTISGNLATVNAVLAGLRYTISDSSDLSWTMQYTSLASTGESDTVFQNWTSNRTSRTGAIRNSETYSLNTATTISNGPLITDTASGDYTTTITSNPSAALGTLSAINLGESYSYNTVFSETTYIGNQAFDSTGTRLVISSYTAGGTGLVKIYVRSGVSWSLETTLQPASNNYEFGRSVAINGAGDLIAVLNYYDSAGVNGRGFIHIYTRSGTTWTAGQIIQHPTDYSLDSQIAAHPTYQYQYGLALSSDGLTLVVPAIDLLAASNPDRLFVYTSSGSAFYITQNISALIDGSNTVNGIGPVAISSDKSTIAIGMPRADQPGLNNTYGAVSIFNLSAGSYSRQTTVWGSINQGNFGSQVNLSSDGNILSASGQKIDSFTPDYTSLGRIYTRASSVWSLTQTLSHSPYSNFRGQSLSMNNDGTILIYGLTIYRKTTSNVWTITNEISISSSYYQVVQRTGMMSSISADGAYALVITFVGSTKIYNVYRKDVTISYNAGTKTLTLTGPKANLNSLIDQITYTPATSYNSNFDFVYTITTPSTNQSIRNQNVNYI